jgi:hypothetical protein
VGEPAQSRDLARLTPEVRRRQPPSSLEHADLLRRLEPLRQQVMFEIPSRDDVGRVVITRGVVLENVNPTLIPREVKTPKRTEREKSA